MSGWVLGVALAAGALAQEVDPAVHEAYLDDLYPAAIVLDAVPGQRGNPQFQATAGNMSLDPAARLNGRPALRLELPDRSDDVRRATAETVIPVEPGRFYQFRAAFRTAAPPDDTQIGAYGFLTLHWLGPDGQSLPTRDKLMSRPGAETRWTAREIKALAPPGATHARLGLVAGWQELGDGAVAWFGDIRWSVLQPAPIRLSLSPRVLRSIDEPVTLRVERPDIPDLTTDGRMIVRIADAEGRTLQEWVEPILITLPWETTLRLPEAARSGSITASIHPVREQPGYVGYSVREPVLIADSRLTGRLRDGRFVIDGKPRLVIGAYHAQPSDYAALKEAGFNVVMTKHYDAAAAVKEFDQLQAMGLYGFEHLGGGGQTLANQARLRDTIEAIKDHPALLAWNLMDEPTRKGIGPREIAEYGVWVQSLAPAVPTTVNLAGPYQFERFGSASDVLSVDPYPVYFWQGLRRPQDPPADLAGVARWMRHADAATPPGRGLIGIVECFTFDPQSHPPATGEEVRNMMSQVVAGGASAVMIYSVRDTGGWLLREQPQFEIIRQTNLELIRYGDWLATDPRSPEDAGILVACRRSDRLIARTWVFEEQPLTMLINLEREPLDCVIRDQSLTLQPLEVRWIEP